MKLRPLPATLAATSVLTGLVLALTLTGPARPARSGGSRGTAPAVSTASLPQQATALATTPLGSVDGARAHLAQVPGDWPGWAGLGGLELERGRATGDPAAYAGAEHAYATSLRLHPRDNDEALAGLAALSAARHEFAPAQRRAEQARAVNPSNPEALAVLTDALTEQGRYPAALTAARQLDDVRPGLASFARLSYQAELRGQLGAARELMRQAAQEAGTPAQIAFARSHEGLLALAGGDLTGAAAAYRSGTAFAPQDTALRYLGARLAWARGDRRLALQRYAELVALRPSPSYASAQAEALAVAGRVREAAAALDVARAAQQLATQARVAPEATDVLLAADHGDPRAAVQQAEQLWRRAPSVGSADALGWALHRVGRDVEALGYADRALSLGGRPALLLEHRGAIRAALGQRAGALADLRAARRADPTSSPLLAEQSAALLRRLAGSR